VINDTRLKQTPRLVVAARNLGSLASLLQSLPDLDFHRAS